MTDAEQKPVENQDSSGRSIHSKHFSGSAFMLLTRLIIKSIGLVSSIILARLLVAEDFGLVAIAMAFYAFIELFGAFGLQTVLIQKQTKKKEDYDTAWTFKVIFGLATGVILAVASPFLADYYNDSRLVLVVCAVGVVSVINGLSNIGVVEFQKDLNFKQELKFQVIPKIISFVVTVSLAVTFRNYWALVFGMIVSASLTVGFSFFMHAYRPWFTLASFKDLFSFSKWLLLQNFVFFMNNRVTDLMIGRLISPAATGLFSVGNEFGSIATTEIAAPINRASFPVYSKLAKQVEELKQAYLNTINMSASVSIPASVGIAIVAPYFVPVVLGPNWLEIIPLLKWIAFASLVSSLSTNNGYIFMACGKPQFNFYVGVCRMLVFIPLLVYCIEKYGLVGAGIAMFVVSLGAFILTKLAVSLFLRLDPWLLFVALYRPVLAAIGMFLGLRFLQKHFAELEAYLMLGMLILAGAVIYVLIQGILWIMAGKPDGVEKNVVDTVIYKAQLIFNKG